MEGEVTSKEITFKLQPESWEQASPAKSRGKESQAEGTACAKITCWERVEQGQKMGVRRRQGPGHTGLVRHGQAGEGAGGLADLRANKVSAL